ncbi:MAG: GyrI-like domain-containing protein [Acidimicrobiales bacterium]
MDIELIEIAEQPTAVVRTESAIADLPALFGRVFAELMAAVAASGASVAGPPFAYYLRPPTDTVDVEIGFPVSGPVTPSGEIVASRLPGGRVVRAVHVGPYDRMEQSYEQIVAWMADHGLTPATAMWEAYLSDPATEPDPSTWRTEITWPVA